MQRIVIIKLSPPHYHLKFVSEQKDCPPLQPKEEEKNNTKHLAKKRIEAIIRARKT